MIMEYFESGLLLFTGKVVLNLLVVLLSHFILMEFCLGLDDILCQWAGVSQFWRKYEVNGVLRNSGLANKQLAFIRLLKPVFVSFNIELAILLLAFAKVQLFNSSRQVDFVTITVFDIAFEFNPKDIVYK